MLRAVGEPQRLGLRDQRDIRRLQKEPRRRERRAAISAERLELARKPPILWEQDKDR